MTEIKPAAWVERTEGGHDRMWSGDLSAWANRPANPEPLYSQAAIDALRKDAERYRYLRKHHVREWESDMAHDKGAPSIDLDFSAEGHDLDAAIDRAMKGANTEAKPTREAGSA